MKKLLEHAEAGDTGVVRRVGRLGRSLMDVLNTVHLLRYHGMHVQPISDGFGTATSTGRTMLNLLASMSEFERDLIVERGSAGIVVAWQSGACFGRPLSDPAASAELHVGAGGNPDHPGITIAITTMMNDYSRAICGYTVFTGAPSSINAALALRQTIWKKTDPT